MLAKLSGMCADGSNEDNNVDGGNSWKLGCDCGSYWHKGNLCSHIGAVADVIGAVDLAVLITQLGGRKLPGRPGKNHGGPLDKVKLPTIGKYASPEWFAKYIEKNGAMCVYKHLTARLFGDEEMVYVGKVWNYRELGGRSLKKQGLWVIKYEDEPEDDTKELTLDELCEALSHASWLGMRGAAPASTLHRTWHREYYNQAATLC